MIRPQMTAEQAENLARFVASLRPGQRAWTKQTVLEALRVAAANRTSDTELLTRAAVAAALSVAVKTPDVIPMTGAHWDGVGDYANVPSARAGVTCARCRLTWMPTPGYVHECAPVAADSHSLAAAARAAVKRTIQYKPEEQQ